MTLNLIYNNNSYYEYYVWYTGDWKYGRIKYTTILYNNDIVYSNDDGICHCNPKNSELDKHLLCFSDLYTDCNLCLNYTHDDREEHDKNEESFNTDEAYKEIKNLITQKPELVFKKNYMGMYPLEFINLLYKVLRLKHDGNDNGKGTLYALSIKEHLDKIIHTIELEYFKYDLLKSVAFRYIKNSNHIGNNAKLFQLPYELWEHIFTFI
jgi:hypothetical protein